jgi:hypothetical protein
MLPPTAMISCAVTAFNRRLVRWSSCSSCEAAKASVRLMNAAEPNAQSRHASLMGLFISPSQA